MEARVLWTRASSRHLASWCVPEFGPQVLVRPADTSLVILAPGDPRPWRSPTL